MKILAILPARGGSKGIPNKNISSLAGKPLIAWTLGTAQASGQFDRIVISTDSEAIASVGRQYGGEAPFLRPEEYARDNTPTISALQHAIRWMAENQDYHPDYVACLQPTSPLLTKEDICLAVQIALQHNADAVVSVVVEKHHPYWLKKIDSEGKLSDYAEDSSRILRRQDLPVVYALNGAFYMAKPAILLDEGTWYTDNTYAYVMSSEHSIDIDTPWDLFLADLIVRNKADYENNRNR